MCKKTSVNDLLITNIRVHRRRRTYLNLLRRSLQYALPMRSVCGKTRYTRYFTYRHVRGRTHFDLLRSYGVSILIQNPLIPMSLRIICTGENIFDLSRSCNSIASEISMCMETKCTNDFFLTPPSIQNPLLLSFCVICSREDFLFSEEDLFFL